jgi:hypothetical protein
MDKLVRLENVIDTRTGKFHSVAIVKEKNAKWFIPANEAEEASDN